MTRRFQEDAIIDTRRKSGPIDGATPASGTGTVGRVARMCVPWLVRRRRAVMAIALVAAIAGAGFGARLYADLRSGIEELLPDSAPSVRAARALGPKLHAVTHLSIVLEGHDGRTLEHLADDLAARLGRLPRDLVSSVEHRTDAEEAFGRRFGWFYLSISELESIQGRIDRRVAWEKRKHNPLINIFGEPEDAGAAPPLDFSDIEEAHASLRNALSRPRPGYFESADGHLLVVLVRPPDWATDLRSNRRLLDAAKAEVAAVHAELLDPPVRVGFGGEVASLVEEQEALAADLLSSTIVVLVLVVLALWIYFRCWKAILAVLGALGVGCALTFGLSYFLVGYLNANTAFLGSIVVGNGINVSIIVVARFMEERRIGRGAAEAIEAAWSGTVVATFVASFGAGLAYLSLSVTDFRGFSQFGVIGGLGMALCWLAAYLLLPPLLAALDVSGGGRRPLLGTWLGRLATRRGMVVRGASLVLAAASIAGVLSYRGDLVEYDLGKLRAVKSAQNGAQYWNNKSNEVFRAYLTPVVVRADTPEELERVVGTLDRIRGGLGERDPIREVRTLRTLVPPDQVAKSSLLLRLRSSLTDSRLQRLARDQRDQAITMRPPEDLRPFVLSDLPDSLRLPLTERDGTAGRIALVYPRKPPPLDARDLAAIGDAVNGAIAQAGCQAKAMGQSLLFGEIATTILRDGPRATALALALVCALVLAVLRRTGRAIQVLGSLLLGVTWLVGAAAAARVRLNFLNFVVLPITFGIAVDYSVNIVQRWKLGKPHSLAEVLENTAGAVALCSATTIIGYGSLLVADNRALRGFGLLASFAELACIGAALLALPAWLSLWDRPAPAHRLPRPERWVERFQVALIPVATARSVPSVTTSLAPPADARAHGRRPDSLSGP